MFLHSEVDVVVVKMNGSKSLDPDGFNFSFYKKFWGLVKEELYVMFDYLF